MNTIQRQWPFPLYRGIPSQRERGLSKKTQQKWLIIWGLRSVHSRVGGSADVESGRGRAAGAAGRTWNYLHGVEGKSGSAHDCGILIKWGAPGSLQVLHAPGPIHCAATLSLHNNLTRAGGRAGFGRPGPCPFPSLPFPRPSARPSA